MKNILLILGLMLVTIGGQVKAGGETDTIRIKTSAICDECKERIEKAMAYEKGVKKATLDVDSKVLTVIYRPDKTTPDKIRKAVAAVGYDADDVPANAQAYEELPGCCKKNGKRE